MKFRKSVQAFLVTVLYPLVIYQENYEQLLRNPVCTEQWVMTMKSINVWGSRPDYQNGMLCARSGLNLIVCTQL